MLGPTRKVVVLNPPHIGGRWEFSQRFEWCHMAFPASWSRCNHFVGPFADSCLLERLGMFGPGVNQTPVRCPWCLAVWLACNSGDHQVLSRFWRSLQPGLCAESVLPVNLRVSRFLHHGFSFHDAFWHRVWHDPLCIHCAEDEGGKISRKDHVYPCMWIPSVFR